MEKTNLKQLLTTKVAMIEIPMVQRDYAQGRPDKAASNVRTRFLADLCTALEVGDINLDFVYGNKEGDRLLPLDGQQRLTTLWLFYWLASRREGIDKGESAWLNRFTYATRDNSRRFCKQLADYQPTELGHPVAEHIRNESTWYLDAYNDDATIDAMLRMLDAIDAMFYPASGPAVADLWHKLDSITFFYESVEDLGLTDEIYIKMNSRGKSLTDFEHVKAELDRLSDGQLTAKFDGPYTDYIWKQCLETEEGMPDVDSRLLTFIRNMARTICLSKEGADINSGTDDYDLVAQIWADEANRKELEEDFDIVVANNCAKLIEDTGLPLDDYVRMAMNDELRLDKLIMFCGLMTYLKNKASIGPAMFARRLRQLRNLVEHSRFELRAGNMPALLAETRTLMLTGIIDQASRSFNKIQKDEEVEKTLWLEANPQREVVLADVENIPILSGSIGTLGLDNLHLAGAFRRVFCPIDHPALLTRALLALGNIEHRETWYRSAIGGGLQKGTNEDRLWANFVFPVDDKDGDQGRKAEAVRRLLQIVEDNPSKEVEDVLQSIIDDYLASGPAFDRRYYLVRYRKPVEKCRFGKYLTDKYIVMTTEQRSSLFAWPVHMLALQEVAGGKLGNDGRGLWHRTDKTQQLGVTQEGFEAFDADGNPTGQSWNVQRDENGVDLVDRVQYAVDNILPQME